MDSRTPYSTILNLMKQNLRLWGGRHNLIVPVFEGKISDRYCSILQHFDPDYIYYGEGVDPDIIKNLGFFNPAAIYKLRGQINEIKGLGILHLLQLVDRDKPILVPKALDKVDSSLLDYFQINFGLESTMHVGDEKLIGDRKQIAITPDNYASLNEMIHKQRPVFRPSLSIAFTYDVFLSTEELSGHESVQIVVAKDKTTIEDLLYFWNCALYTNAFLLYTTLDELIELSKDDYFHPVLVDIANGGHIEVVSSTIDEHKLKELSDQYIIKSPVAEILLSKQIDAFPFEPDGVTHWNASTLQNQTLQTLGTNESLLLMPQPPFSPIYMQGHSWAIDINIMFLETAQTNELLLPLTTNASTLIGSVASRITKNRRVTYFHTRHLFGQSFVFFGCTTFQERLVQLIQKPFIDCQSIESKYKAVGTHDASNRLTAFVNQFKGKFEHIEEYFSDRFWTDLFDDLCQSNASAGDAIALKDMALRCQNIMEDRGITFGEWPETRVNKTNLFLGIKEIVKDLVSLEVMLPGHTLKCPRCSTIAWYSLDNTLPQIKCTGCLTNFPFPVEPDFAYRLNSLIQKNIFSAKSQRDGNLTVIRTLCKLYLQDNGTFEYSPQLNLYPSNKREKPITDLDIIVLKNGKLIIGEAKYNSSEFFEKQNAPLDGLLEAARQIKPDKIVISCTKDHNGKLHKASEYLKHHVQKEALKLEVEAILVGEPDYSNFRISGKYFYY